MIWLYISCVLYIISFIYWVVTAIVCHKKIKEWNLINVDDASVFEKASKTRNIEHYKLRRTKAIEESIMLITYACVFIYVIRCICLGMFIR